MVVIFLPATAETGVMQARVGGAVHVTRCTPRTAPCPADRIIVPVMPRHVAQRPSSGVSCGTSAFTVLPLDVQCWHWNLQVGVESRAIALTTASPGEKIAQGRRAAQGI